ncbi:MAG: phospho-N-acetylmuramoyl-pentapeptide-transferase, partial [Clostridia bacterium]|nr:phospho-N-acetylmuramoyl-pentapeptide-transferase [Clostridia bacterium]
MTDGLVAAAGAVDASAPGAPVVTLLLTAATSAAATLVGGGLLLPLLRRWRAGQAVRPEGPAAHLGKAGTPTMGGLSFVGGAVAATLAWAPRTAGTLVLLATFVAFAAIGFGADFIKVIRRRPLGLRAREKLAGQVAAGLLLAGGALAALPAANLLSVPFLAELWLLRPVLFVPFVVFVAVATANAVNLADGLDGLVAGATAIAAGAFAWMAAAADGPGAAEAACFAAALVGGCLGFLPYNRHPARMFMGDTGALALGGGLAAVAAWLRAELFLPLIGGLYVLEALSVMVQVVSFRLLGRRLLRMSPLHHHFELVGWSEPTVVRRFWAAALFFAVLGAVGWQGWRAG